MGQRKVIENYYGDISNLADLLTKLTNSYRLLVAGAGELNTITLANKKDVRGALRRVDELGEIIDDLLEILHESKHSYMNYCKLKSDILKTHLEPNYIQTEIENELKLQE